MIESIERSYGIELIGSVALNNYVGGLNPEVVRSCAEISGKPIVVWFPTISAENFLKSSRYEILPEWSKKKEFKPRLSRDVVGIRIIDNNKKLIPDARKVLKTIKEFGCILATGHISWEEAEILTEETIGMGIKVIVTHPIYQMIDMPIGVQKRLADMGAFIEQTYAMISIDKISTERVADHIREIGSKNCILSSDVGQTFSKNPSEALREFVKMLMKEGITESEIEEMLIRNPNKIIYNS